MKTLLAVATFSISLSAIVAAFQGGKRDSTPTMSPPSSTSGPSPKNPRRATTPNRTSGRSRTGEKSPKVASVTLKIAPTDSTVLLNNYELSGVSSDGDLSLKNLKPGAYVLAVRRSGFREQLRSMQLKSGENDPVSVTLEPLKGTLIVKPSVDGTSIEVRSIDQNQSVGSYTGGISGIDFALGEYQLTVSKPGYQTVTRSITIKPGLVELEPRIDLLPTPTPSPSSATQSPRVKLPSSSDVVARAVPIHHVIPSVPPAARAAHVRGVVKVSVVVDEKGNVISAKAFDGPFMLRQSAENAALDWRFKPATRNGIPTQSTEIIYFTFEGY